MPGGNVGYSATVLGVIGVLFALAGLRSVFANKEARPMLRRRQFGWILLIVATFGFELAAGIDLLLHPRSQSSIELVSNLLVVSLLIGVARAWELVGRRDTGIISSLAVLAGRDLVDRSHMSEGALAEEGQISPHDGAPPPPPAVGTDASPSE
ncbi:MAG: hypothetical protein ACRDY2_09525 [Acidimicrobiales bacterium]